MVKRKWLRLLWLLPLPFALVLKTLTATMPGAVEKFYSVGLYPLVAAPLSQVSAGSSQPIFLWGGVLLAAGILFLLIKKKVMISAALILGVIALFVGGWGIHYNRLPVEESLGLPVQASTLDELQALCEKLAQEAETAWLEVEKVPTCDEILMQVNQQYRNAEISRPILLGGEWGNPKAAPGNEWLTRWRIEGITVPLTLEALVNTRIPMVFQPYVACHEAAHLRGFAREEDANFIAYLVCSESDDPYFRCSGAVNAYIYAFNALHSASRERAYQTAQCRGEFLTQALAEHTAFWRPYEETTAAQVSAAVNDTYLKTISRQQSADSYGRVVDLLLAWERMEKNK